MNTFDGQTPPFDLTKLDENFASINQARAFDAVVDFGCDNTGATNTTTALKAFYDACISSGRPGYIPAGTYKLTTGVLKFDNGFVDKAFPHIETAGYLSTNYVVDSATATNAPVLAFTNGTATSNGGQYWKDGYHGGITITDSTGAVAASRHGILIRGLWRVRFGYMRFASLRGDGVNIPLALHNSSTHANEVPTLGLSDAGANNPDPYAITFCHFEGIEANFIKGIPVNNQNYVGFNLNHIAVIRAIQTEGAAVLYGLGAGNTLGGMSCGSCKGAMIDDGNAVDVRGGRSELFEMIGVGEWDDPEYGYIFNGVTDHTIKARIIHRKSFTALNLSGKYWPLTAIDAAGGATPATRLGKLDIIHRIEAGGVKADVGKFFDAHSSAGVVTTEVNVTILDNAGFGFSDADLYTGINTNSTIVVTRDKKRIADTAIKICAIAVGTATTTVPANAGWGLVGSIMVYNGTEEYDLSGLHDTTTGGVTIPFTGPYKVTQQYRITAAVGTFLRIGPLRLRSAAYTLVGEHYFYKTNAGAEDILYQRMHYFNQGDVVYPSGACSAGATAVTAGISYANANFFVVEAA